jgi:hypothetical protein
LIFSSFYRCSTRKKKNRQESEHNHKLFVIRANILHHWSSRLLLKFKLHEIQRTWKFLWGKTLWETRVKRWKKEEKKFQHFQMLNVFCHFLQFSASFYLLAKDITEHYGLKIMIFFSKIYYLYLFPRTVTRFMNEITFF